MNISMYSIPMTHSAPWMDVSDLGCVVDEQGQEVRITEDMIQKACQAFLRQCQQSRTMAASEL